jgi:hypothetical protein
VYVSKTIQLESGATQNNPNDSVFISGSSVVNGLDCIELKNEFGMSEIKCDSLGYLVNELGEIQLPPVTVSDTVFNDLRGIGIIKEGIDLIHVPAGTFETKLLSVIQKIPNGEGIEVGNPVYYDEHYCYTRKIWYNDKIGIIKESFYYGSSTEFVKELLRSHISLK